MRRCDARAGPGAADRKPIIMLLYSYCCVRGKHEVGTLIQGLAGWGLERWKADITNLSLWRGGYRKCTLRVVPVVYESIL